MNFSHCGERLNYVLHNRKATPWAKKVGISPGTLARIKQGNIPSHDALTAIMRTENVNLSWFIAGKGKPFMVDLYLDASEFDIQLKNHLEDDPNYTFYFQSSEKFDLMVCVLSLDATYQWGKKKVEYKQVEVVCAPYSSEVSSHYEHKGKKLPGGLMLRLANGEIGTYLLFGDNVTPGLLPDIG